MQIKNYLITHINDMRTIIDDLDNLFDSHDFIVKFARQYEADYINHLHSHGRQGAFRAVHSEIGKFLSENQQNLGITKNGKVISQNVFGDDNEVEQWARIR